MLQSFQNWLFSKARLQVLSVVLAFIAWFAVHSGQQVQERVAYKIRYENLQPQLVFKKEPPTEFRIILKGSLNRLRAILEKPRVYALDLSRSEEGRDVFDIDLAQLDLPLDVRAENPIPQTIEIQLERLERKEIGLKLDLRDVPAKGYVLTQSRVFPGSIEVFGPSSLLRSMNEIRLEVSLDQKKESFSLPLRLDLHPSLKTSVSQVVAELSIEGVTKEQEITGVKVRPRGEVREVKISPEVARVLLRGSEEQLKTVADRLLVEVPVDGLKRGRYRIRGDLKLATGVQVVSIFPESFIVEVIE
jgi:hypothetical protein